MVQRRAVFNDYSRSNHVPVMINTLGWDSVENRRLRNQLCMFYKSIKVLLASFYQLHVFLTAHHSLNFAR